MALKRIEDHFLVPKHELVPEEKIPELLEIIGTGIDSLPKIDYEDPIVKEIMAKKGDVIRISRKSATAEKSYYFRIVV
ncbi:MAG: DNA-directed RNA polymerase subunit H [Candidatus Diapherotrites archaeon]